MIEGANGLHLFAGPARKIRGKSCEPDCRESCARLNTTITQEIPEADIALDRQGPEPPTCSGLLNTGQHLDCAFLTLRKLVSKIFQDQLTANQIEEGDIETIVMDKITPEKAKTLVANDGHWKPDQTAARIFSFSLTISGNDSKKLNKIRDSITEGFQCLSAGSCRNYRTRHLLR